MLQRDTRHKLAANAVVIFTIRLFPTAATLIALVLCSRYLSQSANGWYQKYWTAFSMLSAVICIGLPSLIITIPIQHSIAGLFQSKQVRRRFLAAALIGSIALIAYQRVAPVAVIVSELIILWSLSLSTIAEAVLLQLRKGKVLVWINAAYSVFFVTIHYLLVAGYINFNLLFLILATMALGKCGISTAIVFRERSQKNNLTTQPGDVITSFEKLWLNLAVYDVMQMLFKWVDKLILGALIPASAFAVYFNATQDVPFLPLLLGAVSSSILLHLSPRQQEERYGLEVLKSSSAMMGWIVFPIFFFLALFRNELFVVIFSAKYASAAPIFLISILTIPLRAYNWTPLLQYSGKMRIVNQGAILDLVIGIALMYPLYIIWGLKGIALSFVLSTYVQAGYYGWHLRKITKVPFVNLFPLKEWAVPIVIFGIGYSALYYVLRHEFSARVVLLIGIFVTGICVLLPAGRTFLHRNNRA